ncbi:MAG: VWA domain-containing protein [Bacteroidales bacterium]|jgi:Ca-activated chloride channel family protein|nr:VWA domain-containing protein [Bacteroidales bacterium]
MLFNIEKPDVLYWLLVIIFMAAYFVYYMYKKRALFRQLGDLQLIKELIPEYSQGKQYVKYFTLVLIFALLIVALANPQMGTTVKKAERKGVDLMIALDISNSMNSEDVQPSRLARAKQAIINLTDKLHGDRIGLVVFAGDAFLQLPLTNDYGAAKLFVSSISTDDISAQGTAIGYAIELCMGSFESGSEDGNGDNKNNKAIIVISDGENLEDDAPGAASQARSRGIIVHTVGMGTPTGGPIPIKRNGQVAGYKKDKSGNVVITHLDEEMLAQIASNGGGEYIGSNSSSGGVDKIVALANKLDKVQFESRAISDFETRYWYFVLLALFLLVIDIFIFEKQHKVFNRNNIFGKGRLRNKPAMTNSARAGIITLLLLTLPLGGAAQAQLARTTHKGNNYFENKNFNNAAEEYTRALTIDSNYIKARYNLGNANYMQQQYDKAAQQYQTVLNDSRITPQQRARALYNLGNAQLKQQQYQEAIKSYIDALKLKPNDENTKYNLAYAKQMLKQQQQQQQQNQDNKDNKDNKDNQQQQQQNKQDNKDNKDDKKDQKQNQQDNKPQQNEQQQQQKRQRQKEQQDKAKAEQMLRAFENQEKNTLDKVKEAKKVSVQKSSTDKDW